MGGDVFKTSVPREYSDRLKRKGDTTMQKKRPKNTGKERSPEPEQSRKRKKGENRKNFKNARSHGEGRMSVKGKGEREGL